MKYIGFFDTAESDVKRYFAPSAIPKMKYIANVLADNFGKCEIISLSSVIEPNLQFYKSEQKQLNSKISIYFFPSFGGKCKIIKLLRNYWHLLCLFFYLLKNTKKNEHIVVYHSLAYEKIIVWAKKIKRFKLILELNEIYSDVNNRHSKKRDLENSIIQNSDAYIIPTILLNEKYNAKNKPYIINHSTYEIVSQKVEKFNDDKIHVVYAGTLDPNKGGAAAAAAAAAYLPENYHIHILGFGTESQISTVKQIISETSRKSKASLTYDGLLLGDDFVKFIQKCHIGLSTQDPNAKFNDTSFPSKLLTYLSNGLTVVTIDIKAIKTSKISHCLNYYEKQDPESIAKAIEYVRITDRRSELKLLDEEFRTDILLFFDKLR